MGYIDLLNYRYKSRTILIFIFTMAFCYCGSNAVNVYCFSILASIEDASTAQLFTSIIPIGDIIGPFISIILIGSLNRKNLYIGGLFGCMFSLSVFSILGWAQIRDAQKYFLILFKLIFASSVGPVHWTFPSEIMPPIGIGFFSFAYWVCSLSTVQIYPYLLNGIGTEASIIIFPIVTIFLIMYLSKYMKDSTGKTKEQIENMYIAKQSNNNLQTLEDLNFPYTANNIQGIDSPTKK
ncbi:major facilitator superfamily protein, putative [Ichthyophthirius multifiliis]|uniref:Major facilitator superfamily protein, putative n=1 Tax=Ichthyophthirius multifiliis TaxID=5932 RepID=G0R247_ICHMU|nr:major facilitator superfamily protein, putative [Ichthyophthirius multifiliis]EGR28454.1 major facilitator superfamily protein, putative [Ichthyophthirius multifiliis]|eukprot:XP_004029690.1 major facilitator superfamily protein, putative [Ichthyophthirius multifiliis]